MDGTVAIDSNLQALRRILAGLSPWRVCRAEARAKSLCEGDEEARRPDVRRLPLKGSHARRVLLSATRKASRYPHGKGDLQTRRGPS